MSAPLIARRGVVSGRVQGVAFRYHARDQAGSLALDGWIRNLPDGTVAFHAQGTRSHVTAFIEWLHQGPMMARVSGVEVEAAEVDEKIAGFEIRG
jgi:acylphosphatase